MTITSDEVNFLVYRYLQESGFVHAAFTFAYESQLARSSVVSTEIPPGALISFLQKGLLYVGIEAHVNEDGTERECDAELSLLNPHICRVAQSVSRTSSGKPGKRKRKADDMGVQSPDSVHDPTTTSAATPTEPTANPATEPTPDTIILKGHEKDAFSCLWQPQHNTLISGSSDSTARIWSVNPSSSTAPTSIVLPHGEGAYKDVTTLEWSGDGSSIASGSYDGHTRLWSPTGELLHEMQHHQGPVFAVRWSPSNNLLLSASYDSTVALWDVAASRKVAQIRVHDDAAILDACWKDNQTFATCSSDTTIRLTSVGEAAPSMILRGHADEINSIKWNPSATLLASCSDDCTVKVWSPTETNCVLDLKEHTKDVYTIRWSPDVGGRPVRLASSSFDTTVKLWDVESGKCVMTHAHDNPVYAIAFSPNGDYLASGSISGIVQVWSMTDGSLVKSYKATGDIFEVNWNHDGTLLSACFSTGDVHIMPFRV
ncbi:WD domain-containing protein [Achlya hypogyna]|uniref:WD domain-containing protein n=1 Tax=Achlya hypogyna TaxID=1202772 RepID=A0A1V9ZTZ2_ACHHY|nr:WD domain-containing protein [Achlya hypogyna]